jgi:hypothetical protein
MGAAAQVVASLSGMDEEQAAAMYEPEPEQQPEGEGMARLLTIDSAESLRRTDLIGGADPYCLVHFNGRKVGQTKVAFKTVEPKWGEGDDATFTLRIPPDEGGRLRVQVESPPFTRAPPCKIHTVYTRRI